MAHPVIHFEIPADDVARLKRFYSDLFGWKMTTDPSMPEYVMIETQTEGQGINGGMMKKDMPDQKVLNYILVESVDEYSRKVKKLGGTIIVPKMEIPGIGWFTVALDPEGNQFGIFETIPMPMK